MLVECTDTQHTPERAPGKSKQWLFLWKGGEGMEIVQEAVTIHYILFKNIFFFLIAFIRGEGRGRE